MTLTYKTVNDVMTLTLPQQASSRHRRSSQHHVTSRQRQAQKHAEDFVQEVGGAGDKWRTELLKAEMTRKYLDMDRMMADMPRGYV